MRNSLITIGVVIVGIGDGEGLGVGDGEGLGVGDGEGLGVGDGDGLGVGDGDGLGVGDGEGLGVGDGDGLGVGVGVDGGVCTVVVTVAVLLAELGSDVVEPTVAVLSNVEPSAPLAVATSVIVSAAPAARDEKVIVRSLPDPPHTPAPVEAQETKVTAAGRVSVIKTDCAVAGPRLLTAMV